MTLTFTILGCGSSGGVPRPGTGWGACDPDNPKNRRRRCSLLVERTRRRTASRACWSTPAPDLREQLLDANVDWLDAVLYTHEHADHTHGIDDLRGLFLQSAPAPRRLRGRRDLAHADDALQPTASCGRPAASIRRS